MIFSAASCFWRVASVYPDKNPLSLGAAAVPRDGAEADAAVPGAEDGAEARASGACNIILHAMKALAHAAPNHIGCILHCTKCVECVCVYHR